MISSVLPVTFQVRREVERLKVGGLDRRHRVLARELRRLDLLEPQLVAVMLAIPLNVLQPALPVAALPSNVIVGVTADGTVCCVPSTDVYLVSAHVPSRLLPGDPAAADGAGVADDPPQARRAAR